MHVLGLDLPELQELLADVLVLERHDLGGEQAGVHRAADPDRERADRHAGRHLHDRQERVHPLQRLRLDRHAEHREMGVRRRHAGEVCGPAGAGDDHAQAPIGGGLRVLHHQLRRAMGRHDLGLEADAEVLERVAAVLHRLPVGAGAHDHADLRLVHEPSLSAARPRPVRYAAGS